MNPVQLNLKVKLLVDWGQIASKCHGSIASLGPSIKPAGPCVLGGFYGHGPSWGKKKKFVSQQFWQTGNKRICQNINQITCCLMHSYCSLSEAAVSSYFSLNDIVFIEPYSVDVPDSSVQRPEVPSSVEIQGRSKHQLRALLWILLWVLLEWARQMEHNNKANMFFSSSKESAEFYHYEEEHRGICHEYVSSSKLTPDLTDSQTNPYFSLKIHSVLIYIENKNRLCSLKNLWNIRITLKRRWWRSREVRHVAFLPLSVVLFISIVHPSEQIWEKNTLQCESSPGAQLRNFKSGRVTCDFLPNHKVMIVVEKNFQAKAVQLSKKQHSKLY